MAPNWRSRWAFRKQTLSRGWRHILVFPVLDMQRQGLHTEGAWSLRSAYVRPVSKERAWQRKVKLALAPWISRPGIAAARSECNTGSSEVFSVPIILYLPGLGVAQTILLPSLTVDWSLWLGCLHKGSSFPGSCHRLHQLQSAAGQTSLWADTAAFWQTRLW